MIILTSVGTRGDMEPFLSIGEILKEKGHRVLCAFPEQFRKLANDSNLEFATLGSKYIELLESDSGKAAMESILDRCHFSHSSVGSKAGC